MLVEETKREDVQEMPVESGFEEVTKDMEVEDDNV